MRKTVLILAAVGGLFGIINNFIFYGAGVVTSIYLTHVLLPIFRLTTIQAEIERLIIINAVSASALCIAAAAAGVLYFLGDGGSEKKQTSKYTAAITLVTASLGLIITFSFISMILIAIASVVAVISVRDDYKKNLVPAGDSFSKAVKITALLSAAVLVILVILSLPWMLGNLQLFSF